MPRVGDEDLPNFSAIVGNAAATMVVSNACSVNGANNPSTIFHRYERRRRVSAFSSGVSVVMGGIDEGDTSTPSGQALPGFAVTPDGREAEPWSACDGSWLGCCSAWRS